MTYPEHRATVKHLEDAEPMLTLILDRAQAIYDETGGMNDPVDDWFQKFKPWLYDLYQKKKLDSSFRKPIAYEILAILIIAALNGSHRRRQGVSSEMDTPRDGNST